MRLLFGVLFSHVIMLFGSFFMSFIFTSSSYVLYHASRYSSLVVDIHMFISIPCAAAFGGFVATYAAPTVFKSVESSRICIGFLSSYFAMALLFFIMRLRSFLDGSTVLSGLLYDAFYYIFAFSFAIIGMKLIEEPDSQSAIET